MKILRNAAIIMFVLLLIATVSLSLAYKVNTDPVDKNDTTLIEVEIPNGATKKEVGKILKEKGLIRSSDFFNIYLKLFPTKDFKATTYYLNKSMDIKSIIEKLEKGNELNKNQIKLTFKEGINITDVADIIETNTDNTKEDVFALLQDEKYLDEIIEKYWFLDESIKNEKLYYSLEGYLFPDTYYYSNNKVSVKDIFTKMLNREDEILSEFKDQIATSKYSVKEVIMMASIIEKEGKKRDFDKIASVFYNRISISMKLESCASLYYGSRKKFTDVGIATSEMIQNDNPYNTYMYDGLPAGPISLPGKDALKAAVKPAETEYLYFLSDNEGTTYFFKTYAEHQAKQRELEQTGKWQR